MNCFRKSFICCILPFPVPHVCCAYAQLRRSKATMERGNFEIEKTFEQRNFNLAGNDVDQRN